MNKKLFVYLFTFMVVAILSAELSSCSSDDDNGGLGLSDSEIVSMLQGTWDVSHNGKTQIWTFNGNKVTGIYGSSVSSTFTVSNGVLNGQAFEGGIVISKLTETNFSAYYQDDRSETYSGTKRDSK